MNRRRLYILILMVCIGCVFANAQEIIVVDTLMKPHATEVDARLQQPITFAGASPITSDFLPELPMNNVPDVDPNAVNIGNANYSPYILKWNSGLVRGGNDSYMVGMGFANSANILGEQTWGRLMLQTNLGLEKEYMRGNGITNEARFLATLSYRINNNMSVSALGGMAQTGFISPFHSNTYYYGGYFSLNTNNHKWGVDMGVRRYYNPATGTWTTVPIAMPYYNLNGQKLGVDFGGLLLNVFKGLDKSLNNHHYNAEPHKGGGIIMPEKIATPTFGPPNLPAAKDQF